MDILKIPLFFGGEDVEDSSDTGSSEEHDYDDTAASEQENDGNDSADSCND